jgi:tetratricopeptide (TPR) repeat protein
MKNKMKKSMKLTLIMFILFIFLPVFATAQQTDLDYTMQGDIHLEVYEFDEAIADFTKAIELNPKNPFAYVGRGEAYFNKYQYDQAISDLSKALDLDHENLDPKNADYNYFRGHAYGMKGQYDQAIADFTNAIELSHQTIADPNTDIKESVSIRLVLYLIYDSRGQAYLRKGQYDQALSDANKAIELAPKYAYAYLLKGDACESLKRTKEAIEAYKNYIKYSQDVAQIKEVKKQIAELEKQKRGQEADYGDEVTDLLTKGYDFFNKGQYDQAITYANKVLERDPQSVGAYALRGDAYLKKGQYDQAITDFSKVLERDPKSAESYGMRGEAYFLRGQYDQAIADYTKAIELSHPDLAKIYVLRAAAYDSKAQYDQVLSDANMAIKLDPKSAKAYGLRGEAYSRKGQYDQAIADYTKVIELAHQIIADPNPDIGDWVWISMELDSIYHSRGKAYFRKGQYNQALSDANKAIELGLDWDRLLGMDADVYFLKGMACEKLKRNKEAIEAYKNYIKYSKDAPYFRDIEEVKKRIEELKKQK